MKKVIVKPDGTLEVLDLSQEELNDIEERQEEALRYPSPKALQDISDEYANVMNSLRSGYTQQEIDTFPQKESMLADYATNGLEGMRTDNLLLVRELAGSDDPVKLKRKIANIQEASQTYKLALGRIEFLRDSAFDLIELATSDEDRKTIVKTLSDSYDTIRGQLS